MPTSVHIPKALLEEADRRARDLGISRNHLIVMSLEKELGQAAWPPRFFDQFRGASPDVVRAVESMERTIARSRRSKKAPAL